MLLENNTLKIEDLLSEERFNHYYELMEKEREECHLKLRENPRAEHTASNNIALSYLRCLLDSPQLFPPSNKELCFLDLGSGVGLPVIYAAHHGWSSYGIDFDFDCHQKALKNIQEAESSSFISSEKAHLVWGNFFPPVFVREVWDSAFEETIQTHSSPHCPINPYQQLNIMPQSIDLFYHYQMEKQENMLRFFSQYGNGGSFLLLNTFRNEKVPSIENIGLLHTWGFDPIFPHFSLYQKLIDQQTQH